MWLMTSLLGRRGPGGDFPVHGTRFVPQNRPDRAVFSLSSAGGEGWGEEAVFLAGSWGGGRLSLLDFFVSILPRVPHLLRSPGRSPGTV